MCGIAGSGRQKIVENLTDNLSHRGKSKCIKEQGDLWIGHVLHSVVGDVKQPIKAKGFLVANCEIYNWKELSEKYGYNSKNDAELLLKMLDDRGIECLDELDGIYSFGYIRESKLYLCRDLLGVNPLWYSEEPFCFASEKQALEKENLDSRELHPRQILVYDMEEKEINFRRRKFFDINVEERDIEKNAEKVKNLFLEAVGKRIPEGNLALLFSGGLDSTLVAAALQEIGKDFTCYTSGIQHGNVNAPRDIEWAKKIAEEMDLELEVNMSNLKQVEQVLPQLSDWISSTSTVKLGVALPFHLALNGDEKVVMSGLGSEQLYAGYHRHQGYLNRECLSGLRQLYEGDLFRDNVIGFRNGYEIRLPFLDTELVENALTIPGDQKVTEEYRKYVLRKAAEKLGVPEEVVWRKKTAAQYGSNFDKAIDRLARNKDYGHKQEYLNSLRDRPNNRLVALTSGGKDSNAALYRMKRRNNRIECLLTLKSSNKNSYMFDTRKTTEDIEKQSEKLDKPLIIQDTEGEKEEELEDLKKGLEKAVKKFDVDGVVAGALASTYQRDRVEKVAENLGLKIFTPLWQEDPANYMRWLVNEGFKIEITDVAARGLEEEWVGRILNEENVEKLIELSQEYGFHAAGEGGEYETKTVGFPEKLK